MGRRTFIIMSLLPTAAEFIVTFGPEMILIEVIPSATTDETLAQALRHKAARATHHFTLDSGESRPIDIEEDDDNVITKWRGGEDILSFVECHEDGFGYRLIASEAERRGVAYRYVIFARSQRDADDSLS